MKTIALNDCLLEQLVLQYTRKENILNLVLANTQELVQEVTSVAPPVSDHNIIKLNILGEGKVPETSMITLSYRKGDFFLSEVVVGKLRDREREKGS